MKCPLCSAPTDVMNTKSVDGVPIRRRHCYNNHSFTTKEVVTSPPKPKRVIQQRKGNNHAPS